MKAILWCRQNKGSTLSEKNPANFMKDIIRGHGASNMWPERLKQLRYGGRQVTGYGNVFEFVPYEPGQIEPFPNRFGWHKGVWSHRIQSISMPLATKALGRDDETYLIQVAVKLAVVETHFALRSPLKVIELNHLQIGIKLRLCEVDALFAASYVDENGDVQQLIITAEAKKKNQRILEEQVIQQVKAAFSETNTDLVVPIAMTSVASGIYIAEFKAVRRDELADFTALELAEEASYELCPSVKGI
ncbi:hypothetical protein P9239_18580 [Caballeronia sp. LZ062]|uniref:hypothetical protein n=1 Tax=unclassified Caballeronia TaxID=2646786 RepID=UPI002860E88E|nr:MULTISPECIES: hypothetical protein [unclassified Caballeronia]MDR5855858.1 hypothetical protein [Caballeronia sp. LZ050]MDR5872356.1 hypothetical protein [Caballeronia sp. LZ062]